MRELRGKSQREGVPEDLQDASRAAAAQRDASRPTSATAGTHPAPALRDVSRVDVVAGRLCAWCAGTDPSRLQAGRDLLRRRVSQARVAVRPGRPAAIATAVPRAGEWDRLASPTPIPPYPGKAGYYVERQEVDHASLLEKLVDGYPDGWALSTSAAALPTVLPMCPVRIRVCAWRRQVRPTRSRRPLSAWEPLLVYGGRELPTDAPQDVIDHLDYRGRYDSFPGALVGMKPPEFAVWLFSLLGARPGDELDDLFPGSGAIGRAWALYTASVPYVDGRDASPGPEGRLRAVG